MKKTVWLVFLYAASIMVGGAVGYVYAGSLPSLLMGLFFGTLLLGTSYLMHKRKTFAGWTALGLAIALEGVFTWRFLKTLAFFPAGFLAALSLMVIVIVALKLGRSMREAR